MPGSNHHRQLIISFPLIWQKIEILKASHYSRKNQYRGSYISIQPDWTKANYEVFKKCMIIKKILIEKQKVDKKFDVINVVYYNKLKIGRNAPKIYTEIMNDFGIDIADIDIQLSNSHRRESVSSSNIDRQPRTSRHYNERQSYRDRSYPVLSVLKKCQPSPPLTKIFFSPPLPSPPVEVSSWQGGLPLPSPPLR